MSGKDPNLSHRVLDTTIKKVLSGIRSKTREGLLKVAQEKFDASGWDLVERLGAEALPELGGDPMTKDKVQQIVHHRFRILTGSAGSEGDDAVLTVSSAFQLWIFMAWCRPAYCAQQIPAEFQTRVAAAEATLQELPEFIDLNRAQQGITQVTSARRLFQLRLRFSAFWNLQQLIPNGALNQLVSIFLMEPVGPAANKHMHMNAYYPAWIDADLQDTVLNLIRECILLAKKKAKVYNESALVNKSPRWSASSATRSSRLNRPRATQIPGTKPMANSAILFPRSSQVTRGISSPALSTADDAATQPTRGVKEDLHFPGAKKVESPTLSISPPVSRPHTQRWTTAVMTSRDRGLGYSKSSGALPTGPYPVTTPTAAAAVETVTHEEENSSADSEEDQEIIFLESSRLDFDNWKKRNL